MIVALCSKSERFKGRVYINKNCPGSAQASHRTSTGLARVHSAVPGWKRTALLPVWCQGWARFALHCTSFDVILKVIPVQAICCVACKTRMTRFYFSWWRLSLAQITDVNHRHGFSAERTLTSVASVSSVQDFLFCFCSSEPWTTAVPAPARLDWHIQFNKNKNKQTKICRHRHLGMP